MNSVPKTVTRQRRSCDLNPGPSAPESSTLITRLPSHPIINNTIFFKTAISILLISNHNSFRVLFDKIASVYFIRKTHQYFSAGDGQPREPALCRLYRHTFVPSIVPSVVAHALHPVAPARFCNRGEVRYGSIGGLEYEVPQKLTHLLQCIGNL